MEAPCGLTRAGWADGQKPCVHGRRWALRAGGGTAPLSVLSGGIMPPCPLVTGPRFDAGSTAVYMRVLISCRCAPRRALRFPVLFEFSTAWSCEDGTLVMISYTFHWIKFICPSGRVYYTDTVTPTSRPFTTPTLRITPTTTHHATDPTFYYLRTYFTSTTPPSRQRAPLYNIPTNLSMHVDRFSLRSSIINLVSTMM